MEALIGAGCAGFDEVPKSDDEGAVFATSDEDIWAAGGEAFVAQAMEELKCAERRFGDASGGDEAIAPVKGLFHGALFFEDVGEGPVGHDVDHAVALADG